MSDLPPPASREFRLLPMLRTLLIDPPAAMATIAAARPWLQGLVFAALLVLLNGLVGLLVLIHYQSLDDPNLPDLIHLLLLALTSPWWAFASAPFVACLALGLLAGFSSSEYLNV